MQVKVTPLNPNAVTGEFEASGNVSYPQLAEGKLRIRVAFLPMDERQHELVAKLLPVSYARIVQVSADPLLRIERQDHPSREPKVHTIGSPLWMDIEIGPQPPPAAATSDTAASGESGTEPAAQTAGRPAAEQKADPQPPTPPPPPADADEIREFVDEPDNSARS